MNLSCLVILETPQKFSVHIEGACHAGIEECDNDKTEATKDDRNQVFTNEAHQHGKALKG